MPATAALRKRPEGPLPCPRGRGLRICERQLAIQPSRLSEFITLIRERFEQAAREGEAPVLVTSPGIRPFVRGIVERFRAQTTVLAQSEIHPRARLRTVGSIG